MSAAPDDSGLDAGFPRIQRMAKPLRLPPFGKALQARGPGLVLIVPNTPAGWRTASLYPPGDVLVLQLGHDPAAYAWPVRDCEVVLYADSLDDRTAERMVHTLLRAGGAAVVSIHRAGTLPEIAV